MNMFTDASGNFGCGAIWGNLWLQGQRPLEWNSVNIMVKELVPVVIACAILGSQWSGQHVQFHIDNSSVVEVIKKVSSKEPTGVAMHLLDVYLSSQLTTNSPYLLVMLQAYIIH